MGKICFVCDTPYQVLNSINLYANQCKAPGVTADIYICRNWFRNAEAVIKKLEDWEVFDSVIPYYYNIADVNKRLKGSLRRRVYTYFPKYCIGLVTQNVSITKKHYDMIYISLYTQFSTALVRNNPRAEVVFFDDGIGTYTDRDKMSVYSFPALTDIRHILYYKVFMGGFPRFLPNRIFVYNNEMYDLPFIRTKKKLYPPKRWSNDFKEMLYSVFDFKNDKRYKEKKVVYLAPTDVFPGTQFEKNLAGMEKILGGYSANTIVRLHPRYKGSKEKYDVFEIDNGSNMWEILCCDNITDDHVLLGEYSTAQFNPKLMYDREPWLIILYKALKRDKGKETLEKMESFIQKMRSAYTNPQKIIVLEDLSDLAKILDGVLQR